MYVVCKEEKRIENILYYNRLYDVFVIVQYLQTLFYLKGFFLLLLPLPYEWVLYPPPPPPPLVLYSSLLLLLLLSLPKEEEEEEEEDEFRDNKYIVRFLDRSRASSEEMRLRESGWRRWMTMLSHRNSLNNWGLRLFATVLHCSRLNG